MEVTCISPNTLGLIIPEKMPLIRLPSKAVLCTALGGWALLIQLYIFPTSLTYKNLFVLFTKFFIKIKKSLSYDIINVVKYSKIISLHKKTVNRN